VLPAARLAEENLSERAVEVGSVDRISSAAELRPHLLEPVERALERPVAAGDPVAAGRRRFRWRADACRGVHDLQSAAEADQRSAIAHDA
jgi:hypothetical protein